MPEHGWRRGKANSTAALRGRLEWAQAYLNGSLAGSWRMRHGYTRTAGSCLNPDRECDCFVDGEPVSLQSESLRAVLTQLFFQGEERAAPLIML